MVGKFIPRSEREQRQSRQTFDNQCSKLQNINQSNKDFWEKKAGEDKEYQGLINKQRGVV